MLTDPATIARLRRYYAAIDHAAARVIVARLDVLAMQARIAEIWQGLREARGCASGVMKLFYAFQYPRICRTRIHSVGIIKALTAVLPQLYRHLMMQVFTQRGVAVDMAKLMAVLSCTMDVS